VLQRPVETTGAKRTFRRRVAMAPFDPKRAWTTDKQAPLDGVSALKKAFHVPVTAPASVL